MLHPSLRRLNLEWRELAPLPGPDSWADEPALRHCGSLGEVLGAIRRCPDEVLGALLRVGGATAHRVLLQALLGWAVRAAASDRRHDLDDYLGELWLGIAGYPLARRPRAIAANLTLDTRKRVLARGRAEPVDPQHLASLPDGRSDGRSDGRRATLLLARARRIELIDSASERALRLVYADGLDTAAAAELLGLTPAALRQRCHRATLRLATHAADLGEIVG